MHGQRSRNGQFSERQQPPRNYSAGGVYHRRNSEPQSIPKSQKTIAPDEFIQKVLATFSALRINYQTLLSHPAIKGDDFGDASIKTLEQVLNRSRPATDPEKWIAATIVALNTLSPVARTSFSGFMAHTRSKHLSQLINGSSISASLPQNKLHIYLEGDSYKIEVAPTQPNEDTSHPGPRSSTHHPHDQGREKNDGNSHANDHRSKTEQKPGLSQEACAQVLADMNSPRATAETPQQSYRDALKSSTSPSIQPRDDTISLEVINNPSGGAISEAKMITILPRTHTSQVDNAAAQKPVAKVPKVESTFSGIMKRKVDPKFGITPGRPWADISDDEKSASDEMTKANSEQEKTAPSGAKIPTEAEVDELNSTLEDLLK